MKFTKFGSPPPVPKARLPLEAKLPRPQALDPIPWNGFQWVQGLTQSVVPLMVADQSERVLRRNHM